MSKYECSNCGKQFGEPDIVTESHGEKVGCCPYCHGYFEELFECKICGGHFTDDELTSGVCDGCIYEDVTIERCFGFGEKCREKIEINGFIASMLDEETINNILWEKLQEAAKVVPVYLTEFVDLDKSWWAEKLLEEKQKENF